MTVEDAQGGIFAPIVGKGLRPAYSIGPQLKGQPVRDVMFQCPVSAIPDEVWAVLWLWRSCRLTGLSPVAGGFLDQPFLVQQAFPLFELEYQSVEQGREWRGNQAAAAAAVAGIVGAMHGGKR